MESIIIFAIIAIISALFNKDKKQPEKQKPSKQQMPSFGQQTVPEKSRPVPGKQRPAVKSLEDFANEIFGQLNEKVEQQKPTQPRQSQTIPVVPTPTIETARQVAIGQAKAEERRSERRSERPPLGERPLTKKLSQQSISYAPKSRMDLVQGLVMAEILGPPKAKRK